MRILVLAMLLCCGPATAEIVDGIAATVDDRVITLSDLERYTRLQLVSRRPDESDDRYRRRALEELIEQYLRSRDVRRFGPIDVTDREIDAVLAQLADRHESREAFERDVIELGISVDQIREVLRVSLENRKYIEERFAPLIFVSLDEIERYYRDDWSQQRRDQGLDVPPLTDVREQIRQLLRAERLEDEVRKWTRQLRSRANVDVFVYK